MRKGQINIIGSRANQNPQSLQNKRPASQNISIINVYVVPHSKSKSTKSSDESEDEERVLTDQIKSLSYNVQNVGSHYRQIISYTLNRQSKNKWLTLKDFSIRSKINFDKRRSYLSVMNALCDSIDCNKSLFMIAYLFDRMLQYLHKRYNKKIVQEQYEIAATSCIFTAMKLCEIYPPDLEDLLEMLNVPRDYKRRVISLQSQLLLSLQFNTMYDSQEFFVNLFGQLLRLTQSQQIDCLAVLQYGMLFQTTVGIRPSHKAAAAINLLCHFQESSNIRLELLLHLCHLKMKELSNISRKLMNCIVMSKHQNITIIYEKYFQRYGRHIPWFNQLKKI